jgi:hypothetical protein
MAEVYSLVLALPPRSPVMALPSEMVCDGVSWTSIPKSQYAYGERSLFNSTSILSEAHMPLKHLSAFPVIWDKSH